jgi:hypothetical protein
MDARERKRMQNRANQLRRLRNIYAGLAQFKIQFLPEMQRGKASKWEGGAWA